MLGLAKNWFFVIVLSITSIHAQDYDTIIWEENNTLKWENFQGKPPVNHRAAAITASGITYRYSAEEVSGVLEVKFKVSAFFYPKKSWYRPSLCDSVTLGHEQLHFNISELYARKLKKRLEASTFSSNLKAEVAAIYKQVLQELNAFQNAYDSETNFSRDRQAQNLWQDKITLELQPHKTTNH